MTSTVPPGHQFFVPFGEALRAYTLPDKFTYPFKYEPHPLSLRAVAELQQYLTEQNDWEHNFGLTPGQAGAVIGKMFGVLVVRTQQNEVGYLAAFSGKLAGGYHHAKFVPPVFDGLTAGSFLNIGMTELSRINHEIKALGALTSDENLAKIDLLLELRRKNSIALQAKLFDQYNFLNQAGVVKSLREIFRGNSNPPAGAGECAAPKLLHYAFQHNMQPLAMAEFWWGLSPKSDFWKHGHFYPACHEKCEPILAHMLEAMALDEKPV
ncbi:pseudouridylate synthase [uncultured Pontibacter sp.]|uniref:pseudouridylate synthase n=1 Tax=uncultured Pontibacter sp. TaxID=453356 RepID=UPI00260BACFC|nr:pseudouridylate synthase [uncultured Pontibacter sp.]